MNAKNMLFKNQEFVLLVFTRWLQCVVPLLDHYMMLGMELGPTSHGSTCRLLMTSDTNYTQTGETCLSC